jgi:hypothetical protein
MSFLNVSSFQHFQQLNVSGCEWDTLGLLSRGELTGIIESERMSHRASVKLATLWRLSRLDHGIAGNVTTYHEVFNRVVNFLIFLP